MDLAQAIKTHFGSDRGLADRLGVCRSYVTQIRRGKPPSAKVAAGIWRETGCKLGPLERLSDDECEIFAKAVSS